MSTSTHHSDVVDADVGGPNLEADWSARNRTCLLQELERVRRRLAGEPALEEEKEIAADSVLALFTSAFGLSPFERDVLLMAAGVELSAEFARTCAEAQGPSFGLAMAALAEPHWSALTPSAPLRHWRLVTLDERASLTTQRLRLDEWALHALAGAPVVDERLMERAELLPQGRPRLAPGQKQTARDAARAVARPVGVRISGLARLWGGDDTTLRAVACSVGRRLGRPVYRMAAASVPSAAEERDGLARLWEREHRLSPLVLLLELAEYDPPEMTGLVEEFLARADVPLLLSSRSEKRLTGLIAAGFEVGAPGISERAALWRAALGGSVDLGPHAAQFRLGAREIGEIAARAAAAPGDDLADTVWSLCRAHARPAFQGLAERIEARARRDDLVVSDETGRVLDEIVVHVRQRHTVEEVWGFGKRGGRNLGLTALFHGPSGTGKTLAAETIAAQLALDLYRVDLSRVVDKYIGETEKNLSRIFDAARAGGAVLLFDEADALFGKRSEVKDSHDRHANIEIAYLLQAMEEFRGLAILTTNSKDAIDLAFLRRLRFVATFNAPDEAQRQAIWRRVFPAEAPTRDLDFARLARLNLAGGSIRNIAVAAAMLAADAREPIGMKHALRAAQVEAAKLGRALSRAELAGWPIAEEG